MSTVISIEQIERRRCRYEVQLSDAEFERLQAMPWEEALVFLQGHEGLNVQDEGRNLCPELITAVHWESPSGTVNLREPLQIQSTEKPREEVQIVADTGVTIAAPAYPCDCYYVRLLDDQGREVGYWDNAEWQDDPQLVMGAIIGAICAGG